MADNFELKFRLDDGGLSRQLEALTKSIDKLNLKTKE